jgi:hypothetical protein
VRSGKKLENHSRGDDGCNAQFHQRSTITCHYPEHRVINTESIFPKIEFEGSLHSQPVDWVRAVGRHDTVERPAQR